MIERPSDLVWQTARTRVLMAFARQRQVGIESHGQPLPVHIDGMDMAQERLYELVDAIVYETAELIQREQLRAENAQFRARIAELEAAARIGRADAPDDDGGVR